VPDYKNTWKQDNIEYSVVIPLRSRIKAINAFHRIRQVKEIIQKNPGYRGSLDVDAITKIEEVGK
jgi:hypothetical protein